MVIEGSRSQGFKDSSDTKCLFSSHQAQRSTLNAKELQGLERLAKVTRTLFENVTTVDYIRMLYISYGSVCELETQILLAGDLGYIGKGESGTAKQGIAEIVRMLKALIKSLEIKQLNP